MKRKWLIIGFVVLIALALVFVFSGNILVLRQVNDMLKTQVRNQLGEGWEFDYDGSRLNLRRGELKLFDIELIRQDEQTSYWSLHVKSIRLHGFKSAEFLSSGSLRLDSLLIDNPVFEGYAWAPMDSTKEKRKVAAAGDGRLSGLNLQAEELRTRGGKLKWDPAGAMKFSSELKFVMKDLSVDGSTSELVTMSRGELTLPEVYFQFPDSMYVMTVDSIEVMWGDTLFAGHGLHLKANLDRIAYGHHYGFKKARWDVEVPEWYMTPPDMVDTGLVQLSTLYLNRPYAEIFKDGRLPFPDHVKKYPQQLLEAIPIDFGMDRVEVNDGVLVIEELHGERKIAARIELTELNAAITDLQNSNQDDPAFVMAGSAMLQGSTLAEVRAEYSYGYRNPYTLTGRMDPTHLSIMKKFLEHSGNLSIKSGQVDNLSFDLRGNQDTTFGAVDFRYSNLEVELVDKATGESKGELVNFFTGAFGGLVYHKDNPSAKYGLHLGKVGVANKPYKAFIGHWMEGLLDGLINSVLRTKTQKRDRAYRKQVREKRKEEKKAKKEKG